MWAKACTSTVEGYGEANKKGFFSNGGSVTQAHSLTSRTICWRHSEIRAKPSDSSRMSHFNRPSFI